MSWHIGQSSHNFDTKKYLAQVNPLHKDWEVTTLFYSAVHVVDSYLVLVKNTKPRTHAQRRKLVKQELSPIFDDYDLLESLSRKSRYDSSPQELTPDEERAAHQWHRSVDDYVGSQLKLFGFV